jgi:hypothetical protein
MTDTPGEPLDDETALDIAIGKVMREWAETEILLGWFLTQFLQTDSFRARIVWGSLPNMRSRIELLQRFAETYLDDPVLDEFTRIMKRVKKLGGKRNLLAHSHGGVLAETREVVLLREQIDEEVGYDFLGRETFHINNVLNWPNDITQLRQDLMRMLKRVRESTHASPKIHRGPLPGQTNHPAPPAPDTPSQSE